MVIPERSSAIGYTIKQYELYNNLKNMSITYKRANKKNSTKNTKRALSEIQDLHKKITTINANNQDNIDFIYEAHIILGSSKNYG